jgi:tryptophan synthase alpha chain
MALEDYIAERLKEKDILLMTHIVLGYPSLQDSYTIVEKMVEAGVDLMELQIPFSEPIADGPVILNANQKALENGTTVKQCIKMSQKITQAFDIPFLFMTYYNIVFKYGIDRFTSTMADIGIKGAIIPDLPPEEATDFLDSMAVNKVNPIFIFSPNTPASRMKYISSMGHGFIYCVARKGVTGNRTSFSKELNTYLATCRNATHLPLALGFGVEEKDDIEFLKGQVDIAIVGSQAIRIINEKGVDAVGDFIRQLQ